jgi:hypothetical protein
MAIAVAYKCARTLCVDPPFSEDLQPGGVPETRQADLGALWNVRNGAAAYAELVEMFLLHGAPPEDLL